MARMRVIATQPDGRPAGALVPRRLWLGPAIVLLARIAGYVVPFLLFAYVAFVNSGRFLQLLAQGAPTAGRSGAIAHYGLVAHSGLTAVFMGSMAILVLIRKEPVGKLSRLTPQLVAIAGTCLVTAITLQPKVPMEWWVPVVSSALMAAGIAFALATVLVLGRSFGILPEARSLVTSGPYRYVRHPLYAAEALSVVGLLLPVFSLVSVAIFGAILVLQALRTRFEEEVLTAVFPEYDAYRRTTWRFIPGVF